MQTTASLNSIEKEYIQLATFKIGNHLFCLPVEDVQEIVRSLPLTPVPLAPHFVIGLINLRGQIATAIDMNVLLKVNQNRTTECFNVICKIEDQLIALSVDEVGDVLDLSKSQFEQTPDIIDKDIRQYLTGVFKVDFGLVSLISLEKIYKGLNENNIEEEIQ